MRPNFPHLNTSQSHRLRVGSGPSEVGSRIGGRPPGGVKPFQPGMVYFVTIDIPGLAQELSIFVTKSIDYFYGPDAGRLVGVPSPGVNVVLHQPSPRATRTPWDSPVSEHPLVDLGIFDDLVIEDGHTVAYSGHKIGGRPYLVRADPNLDAGLTDLESRGFVHCLQLDFPVLEGDEEVSGPWPTGTAMFHLFARLSDGDAGDWHILWQE